MLKHLLILRLSLVAVAGCVLAIGAHAKGLIVPIFVSDVSYLSYATAALFAAGLVSALVKGAKIGAAVDEYKTAAATAYHRRATRARTALKMRDKIAHLDDIAGWLQLLGLLGTVIGFYVAIDGMAAGDTAAVTSGLRTAIGTTIIGGFLSLWTSINYRIIDTTVATYIEDVR
jgi:biopolymer transport protein ExbB/TolQ